MIFDILKTKKKSTQIQYPQLNLDWKPNFKIDIVKKQNGFGETMNKEAKLYQKDKNNNFQRIMFPESCKKRDPYCDYLNPANGYFFKYWKPNYMRNYKKLLEVYYYFQKNRPNQFCYFEWFMLRVRFPEKYYDLFKEKIIPQFKKSNIKNEALEINESGLVYSGFPYIECHPLFLKNETTEEIIEYIENMINFVNEFIYKKETYATFKKTF